MVLPSEESSFTKEIKTKKCCLLQYCNGIRHNNSSAVYMYPVCHVCGIELNDLLELLRNQKLTSTESCEICAKIYSKDSNIEERAHFMKHFYKNTEKYEHKFYCYACTNDAQIFDKTVVKNYDSSISLYFNHARKHNTNDGDENKEWICRKCGEICKSRGLRRSHMQEAHKHNNLNKYPCRLCDLKFSIKIARKEHETEVHKDKSTDRFQCTECHYGFRTPHILLTHMLSHKPVISYVCDICGKGFTLARYLKYHMVTHVSEKRFECEKCPSKFKGLCQLKKHLATVHATVKKYECNICFRRFSEIGTLSKHKWTHGGYEKKFKCTLCNMKFYEAKRLRYHMKKHDRVKKSKTLVKS